MTEVVAAQRPVCAVDNLKIALEHDGSVRLIMPGSLRLTFCNPAKALCIIAAYLRES